MKEISDAPWIRKAEREGVPIDENAECRMQNGELRIENAECAGRTKAEWQDIF